MISKLDTFCTSLYINSGLIRVCILVWKYWLYLISKLDTFCTSLYINSGLIRVCILVCNHSTPNQNEVYIKILLNVLFTFNSRFLFRGVKPRVTGAFLFSRLKRNTSFSFHYSLSASKDRTTILPVSYYEHKYSKLFKNSPGNARLRDLFW